MSRFFIAVAAVCVLSMSVCAQDGRKLALLVGVQEYEHSQLTPLKYTGNDVTELGQLLQKSGYTVVVLTDSTGKVRADRKPTLANIRSQLAALVKGGRRADTILVGFSGHGLQYEDETEPLFCPADARPASKKGDRENMLGMAEVMKTLDDSGIGTKLLLIDACRNNPGAKGIFDASSIRPPKGTAVLFSCSKEQRAFEHESFKHGVFFHFVIAGLKGEARNNRNEVTWASLLDYVQEKVTTTVPSLIGDGARQEPNAIANTSGKSAVLLRVDDEAPAPVIVAPKPEPKPQPAPVVEPPPVFVNKNPMVGTWVGTYTYNGVETVKAIKFNDNGTFNEENVVSDGVRISRYSDSGPYWFNNGQLTADSKYFQVRVHRSIKFDGNKAHVYVPEAKMTIVFWKQ